MQAWVGHVQHMQPVAHTTSCDSVAVSKGTLEVLLKKYLRHIRNARLFINRNYLVSFYQFGISSATSIVLHAQIH